MTARRQYTVPPPWSRDDIVGDCRRAVEAFVDRRLTEGAGPYRDAFTARLGILEALFNTTNALTDLDAVRQEQSWARKYADALRYLAGPVVSADDLKTLSRSTRFADLPPAERKFQIVRETLDELRFPWVAENRPPRPEERDQALRSTAGLWATETTRTRRRVRESREQEEAVISVAQSANFQLATLERRRGRARIERPEDIPSGHYTREINIAGQKCDVPIRLRDGRLLAVECKVSNSEVNSYKRLQRETCGKARQWERDFGRHGVLTSAVLRGVFSPTNVIDAQDEYGVAIFWEHNLEPLRTFLGVAR